MEDVIRLSEQFYIIAETDRAAKPTRVLKHGESFAVFDLHGDFSASSENIEHGLYYEGTRFLSRLELLLGERQPLLLSSTVRHENDLFTADLTNPDVSHNDMIVVPRGELHIFRSRVVWDGAMYEWIRLTNYALRPLEIPLGLRFGSDFADIFEVRGMTRDRRGESAARVDGDGTVHLDYVGLDNVRRTTHLVFDPAPPLLTADEARFGVQLAPRGSTSVLLTVACDIETRMAPVTSFDRACAAAGQAQSAARARACHVFTANEGVNDWINRSAADLQMMTTETSAGLYPYAGVPWFSTVFGRDGIITAFEVLWSDPDVARGVLGFLAATQADSVSAPNDAEPGKILHELRGGEMAGLGEVPFARYYGTVDATPLFVMLADAYYDRTGDLAFVRFLWPHIGRALDWMRTHGDRDGDGFVEYARRSEHGLVQQGWKDSHDSIFHADDTDAEPPIALCEVQGYAYAAKRGAARLADRLGDEDLAARLAREAEWLRLRFEEAFWCEDLGTYALALDGAKRPCRVRTSNAGHCLFTGIASEARARRTSETLMDRSSLSGWGIRTVAAGEIRYNPMSYHNGSVWPHDTALAAAGMARYGLRRPAVELLSALLDASTHLDLHRMPELVCGFHRRPGEGPTLYPVACAPQSWAAASVFLLMQSCLGLIVEGGERRVVFDRPMLPDCIPWMKLQDLRVGEAMVDLQLVRHDEQVLVEVVHKVGEVALQVLV